MQIQIQALLATGVIVGSNTVPNISELQKGKRTSFYFIFLFYFYFYFNLFSSFELENRVQHDITSHCHKLSQYDAVMVTSS